ncbi:MAG: methyl-accepting chemotaxis protein [Deltaproteobacteria bacterium]|nr:methyl-accepting chemotaxis protein [Candidatus Zymogenaceae bacterium]
MEPGKKERITIGRRMIIYLMIIVLTVLTLGIEFMREVGDENLRGMILDNAALLTAGSITEAEAIEPLVRLRNKVMLLLAIQVLITSVVLVIFVKKITLPLRRMFRVGDRISTGDLKEAMPVYTNDEIGRMGEFINDLISDFGEVVGHVRIFASSGLDSLDDIQACLIDPNGTEAPAYRETEHLRRSLVQLHEMTEEFTLFSVEPEGKWNL